MRLSRFRGGSSTGIRTSIVIAAGQGKPLFCVTRLTCIPIFSRSSVAGPILTGSSQQLRWHTHSCHADFIIDLDAQVFSRRLPWHPQAGEHCSLTRGSCKGHTNLFSRSSFRLNPVPCLFPKEGRVVGLSDVFGSPCIPLGTSVDFHVLKIAGLDFDSGLKMGDFLRSGLISLRVLLKLGSAPSRGPENAFSYSN